MFYTIKYLYKYFLDCSEENIQFSIQQFLFLRLVSGTLVHFGTLSGVANSSVTPCPFTILILSSNFMLWWVGCNKKKQFSHFVSCKMLNSIGNYDICVWHPPTFDTCSNFLCKRNYVLKQVPTPLLDWCLKIRIFFWGLP